MTLPRFNKALDFVLLDKPVDIVSRISNRRFKIVAVAISGPQAEQQFLFALAVNKGAGKYNLTILSRWIGFVKPTDELEDEWIEARKVFFSPWVKTWLASHPEQLIQAGAMIGQHSSEKIEMIMPEHWHNIYVRETVEEVVTILQVHGIRVEYNPQKEDPEDANGYIQQNGGVISSCVRWRRNEKKTGAKKETPKESMACLQLLSSAGNFDKVRRFSESTFHIIKDCSRCKE